MPEVKLHKWDEVERESLTPLLDRQMVYGERIMLSRIYLQKDSVVALHHHENEQASYVLEGAIRFYYGHGDLKTVDVYAGEVLFLPSNVPHSAEALEDSVSLDIFNPPRQDWIDGTDAYIRKQG
ncbi:MAG: cupin domain-containing protein [Rhodothermaceae bacterium]|nr:cupin domain-containing protein [Rhodothermaceae bacterium]